MWKNGYIELLNPTRPHSIIEYIKSIDSLWFHILIIVLIITILSFVLDLTLIRIIMGTLFLLFLPGYLLLEFLYPTGSLHSLEKIAFSISLSMVLVSLLGLIMNFTPTGILSLETIVLIAIVNLALGVLVLLRKYDLTLHAEGGH